VAKQFVRARLVRITGVDLNLFDFDYDLTWVAFLMDANERVYGRYGGRDAKSAEDRLSLVGLRNALRAALDAHRTAKPGEPRKGAGPLLAEEYPAAKKLPPRQCIHCHQVHEFRRAELQAAGKWNHDAAWIYPLPENVGITLDVDEGDKVRAVKPGSAAAGVGLQPKDRLRSVNGTPVASFADVQYALHRAPKHGTIAVAWQRGTDTMSGTLKLADGWRKTNLTWRPSMLDILPALTIYGADLTANEKQTLGLPAGRLAFRQNNPVPKDARAAGIEAGDIIIGVDGLKLDMTVDDFLGYVRQNYFLGDRMTLNVLRQGRRVDLPMTLK
jgi:hypothetical protein